MAERKDIVSYITTVGTGDRKCLSPDYVDCLSYAFKELVHLYDVYDGSNNLSRRSRDFIAGLHVAAEIFRLRQDSLSIPLPEGPDLKINNLPGTAPLLVPHEANPASPLDGLEGDI